MSVLALGDISIQMTKNVLQILKKVFQKHSKKFGGNFNWFYICKNVFQIYIYVF
ncbi:hypothetical protein ADIS_3999 [Lunatimonas lonarensis]|uniref:Uncharacterized protein n=1 Tax=Lunatimonas lonarensis TaxID=1232681 RepID=R7ZNC0_9BACT|nr:hypothetical protein ADIS_3999 [Lunatimonas lonarensis]